MLDARGLSCPEPVIMIQQAIRSNEKTYEIMVDNRTSVENITRFGEHNNFTVTFTEDGGDYTVTLNLNADRSVPEAYFLNNQKKEYHFTVE